MIVYGTGSKKLGVIKILNEKCPNCDAQNEIHLHGIAKYFDIFWIPIFPYRKKIIPICHSCDVEIDKKQITSSLKEKINLEKSNFKTPIYLFIGLALIISLILWFRYDSQKHKGFVMNRIHYLESNDVIVFKQGVSEYTFAKVESVENDTVYFVNSNYSLNQKPLKSDYTEGIKENEDFFSEDIYLYSQKQIDSLHNIGEIDIFEIEN